mmetsp:Transcript_8927/g.23202  ORF Transcript_8927/g.23202 Transcript_8927/m.23202 type:complete len:344 (+) Transcript_8927:48-1079(+)
MHCSASCAALPQSDTSAVHALSGCKRTPSSKDSASRRCASADYSLDWFLYPDGTAWSLPAAWGVKDYLARQRKAFQTSAFLVPQPGDSWQPEGNEACQLFHIPDGFVLEDVPIRRLAKPRRMDLWSSEHGWFVDQWRLLSVLQAMLKGTPLPPVQVAADSGSPLRVVNGYHRYYASLLLRYKDIPVLREVQAEDQAGAPVLTPARHAYEPPAVRRQREEQEVQKRRDRARRDLEKSILEDAHSKATRERARAERDMARSAWMKRPASDAASWAKVACRREQARARQQQVTMELAKFLSGVSARGSGQSDAGKPAPPWVPASAAASKAKAASGPPTYAQVARGG